MYGGMEKKVSERRQSINVNVSNGTSNAGTRSPRKPTTKLDSPKPVITNDRPSSTATASSESSNSQLSEAEWAQVLQPSEKIVYDELWAMANKGNQGTTLGGLAAVSFFEKSGLDVAILRQIWTRCSSTPVMTRLQFYSALRYVSMVQRGYKVSRGEFKSLLRERLPLPAFHINSTDKVDSTKDTSDSNLTSCASTSDDSYCSSELLTENTTTSSEALEEPLSTIESASLSTLNLVISNANGDQRDENNVDYRNEALEVALNESIHPPKVFEDSVVDSKVNVQEIPTMLMPAPEVLALQAKVAEMEEMLRLREAAMHSLNQELSVAKADLIMAKENVSQNTSIIDGQKLIITKAAMESGDIFQGKINAWLVKAGFAVVGPDQPTQSTESKSSQRTAAIASIRTSASTLNVSSSQPGSKASPDNRNSQTNYTVNDSEDSCDVFVSNSADNQTSVCFPLSSGNVESSEDVEVTQTVVSNDGEINASTEPIVSAPNDSNLMGENNGRNNTSLISAPTADTSVIEPQTSDTNNANGSRIADSTPETEFESIRLDFDDAPPWLNLDIGPSLEETKPVSSEITVNFAPVAVQNTSSTLESQSSPTVTPAQSSPTPARRTSTSSFGFSRIANALFGGFGTSTTSSNPTPSKVASEPAVDTRDLSDPGILATVAGELIASSSAKVAHHETLSRSTVLDDSDEDEDDLILVRYNGASQYVTANELYLLVIQELLELRESLRKE